MVGQRKYSIAIKNLNHLLSNIMKILEISYGSTVSYQLKTITHPSSTQKPFLAFTSTMYLQYELRHFSQLQVATIACHLYSDSFYATK